ncbi:MAG: glycosyltransferase family 39 protein [Deltaproteobacteria bacterium]|jgi:4-amino-4-deoxy-L-arabinose transferase-like glycosyltransferase|nr:glycosyltransferase family 39 protein [Deltaproteobacteria bacterium]
MKSETFSIAKYLPVLVLVIFLSFFAHLGSVPLFDADEGAFSEVTREMLTNNDFTSSLLNDAPFFHKPPLFFWIQAVSIKLLGLNEFALRLPSALSSLLWVVTFFLFARRTMDTRTAWYATLFMTSSFLICLVGRAAIPEAMFNLFLTLTLLNIYRFYLTGNRRHIYWLFMFAGLGVLTKGSIAVLIPLVTVLFFFMLKKRWHDLLKLLFNPVGLIVFGLIVIPWYFAEFMLYGEAFLSDLFLIQNAKAGNLDFIGSSLPYYLYPVLILFGLLPNTAILIKALSQLRKLAADNLVQFMIIWFITALLFMPVSQPRSPFAIICGLPPLFIIMAKAADSFRHTFNLLIWPLFFIAFFCLIPDIAPHITGSINNEFVRNLIPESFIYFDAYYRITLGAILLLLTALPFINPAPTATKYAISGLLFVGAIHFLILPILGNMLQQPIKSAALLAKKEGMEVSTWRFHPPSFNLYAEILTDRRRPEPEDIVLTKTAYLKDKIRYETLFEKHGIILARISSIE